MLEERVRVGFLMGPWLLWLGLGLGLDRACDCGGRDDGGVAGGMGHGERVAEGIVHKDYQAGIGLE